MGTAEASLMRLDEGIGREYLEKMVRARFLSFSSPVNKYVFTSRLTSCIY
jgi:hypothetical protein